MRARGRGFGKQSEESGKTENVSGREPSIDVDVLFLIGEVPSEKSEVVVGFSTSRFGAGGSGAEGGGDALSSESSPGGGGGSSSSEGGGGASPSSSGGGGGGASLSTRVCAENQVN
eukprot:170110-Amorphochlora_amoeboformis.AAC.2